MSTIALEEHFTTSEFRDAIQPFLQDTPNVRALQAKLLNLGAERIAAMDKGAVDLQVLSLPSSGFEKISSDVASGVAHDANDELAEAIRRHPTRIAGFALVNLKDESMQTDGESSRHDLKSAERTSAGPEPPAKRRSH